MSFRPAAGGEDTAVRMQHNRTKGKPATAQAPPRSQNRVRGGHFYCVKLKLRGRVAQLAGQCPFKKRVNVDSDAVPGSFPATATVPRLRRTTDRIRVRFRSRGSRWRFLSAERRGCPEPKPGAVLLVGKDPRNQPVGKLPPGVIAVPLCCSLCRIASRLRRRASGRHRHHGRGPLVTAAG